MICHNIWYGYDLAWFFNLISMVMAMLWSEAHLVTLYDMVIIRDQISFCIQLWQFSWLWGTISSQNMIWASSETIFQWAFNWWWTILIRFVDWIWLWLYRLWLKPWPSLKSILVEHCHHKTLYTKNFLNKSFFMYIKLHFIISTKTQCAWLSQNVYL
jgi:hypothetical protein